MIELPRDANGCVIPLDTKVLYDECDYDCMFGAGFDDIH